MRNNVVKATVLLSILFIGWALWIRHWYHSVSPAGPTLREHLMRGPFPEHGRIIVANGQEFLVLEGIARSIPRFPSGPPVYVFNRNGQVVDWTSDEGDDGEFIGRWPSLYQGRVVTRSEIETWPGGK